jgi:hypothetical protein
MVDTATLGRHAGWAWFAVAMIMLVFLTGAVEYLRPAGRRRSR